MVYLFVHVIWSVHRREALLSKPVRKVLFAHLQKDLGEKGIRIVAMDGVEDHVHCLIQLLPSQNLLQVLRTIRAASASWINESKLVTLPGEFQWDEAFWAASVSPSGVKQVVDYIAKQEEHHKTKSFESELEIFEKFKDGLV